MYVWLYIYIYIYIYMCVYKHLFFKYLKIFVFDNKNVDVFANYVLAQRKLTLLLINNLSMVKYWLVKPGQYVYH